MSSYKFREDVIKQAAKKDSQLHLPRQVLQKNFRENGFAQAAKKGSQLHLPRQALQKNFREDGFAQAAKKGSQLRKAPSQKDPQEVEKEALYRAFLKGSD